MREIVIVIVVVILAAILFWNIMPKKGEVIVINCSISEISPDFTPEMRQACRDARKKGL
jgi:L-lactate permease